MEAVDPWLLKSWNGTDRGDFVVGSCCRKSVYRLDVWMTRNIWSRCRLPGWRGILAGWMDFIRVGRWDFLRIFFCEGRLWSICRANISDVIRPASSCCITILRVMNTKGKMFCITSVEFLMKVVKNVTASVHHTAGWIRLDPVGSVSSFDSFRSPCPSLNLGSPWVLVSVLFE